MLHLRLLLLAAPGVIKMVAARSGMAFTSDCLSSPITAVDEKPTYRLGPCGPTNPELLLHGERHTATNFFGVVLQHNLGTDSCREPHGSCAQSISLRDVCQAGRDEPTDMTYCCWKHGYANSACQYPNRQPGTPYPTAAFIARSPYPWLLSMYQNPYEYQGGRENNTDQCADGCCTHDMTFGEFIRAEFRYHPNTNDEGVWYYPTVDVHSNPMLLWNDKVKSISSAWGPPGQTLGTYHHAFMVNITHSALYNAEQMDRALQPLLTMGFQLQTGSSMFSYPPFCTTDCEGDKWSSDTFSQEGFDTAAGYDEGKEWLQLISPEDLAFINSQVDHGLMARWGFELVEPSHAVRASSVERKRGGSAPLAPSRRQSVSAAEAWADPELVAHHMRQLNFLK